LSGLKKTVIRAGLETLYFSGAHALMKPFVGGIGAILTLHHVRPPRPDRFQPNQLLEVTPRFLENVVRNLRRRQLDLSWWVIRGLEKLGLVWNVQVPDAAQLERRRVHAV